MHQSINTKALALSLGILWSLALLSVSIIALISESYLHNIVEFLSSIYLGYSLSFTGILIGMIWAFIDAAVGGLVLAWLYNKLAK
ncbi:MAG: bacteriophage holin [Proteobacteria bacterium]|nr:bacteriophage holin [Pseudomonadota bacterium]MCH9711611.1 bacteriophage holin [Pseudomonadota bacterium]MCH9750179.1 bacteriophage holin [Pseudomonadota bacterium]